MITALLMIGSGVCSTIECGPGPGILKAMVSSVGLAFESMIACRNEPGPELAVVLTVNVAGPESTVTHAENSDVSFVLLVAVAVTTRSAAALKSVSVPLPFGSV